MKAVLFDGLIWPGEVLFMQALRRRLVRTARGRILEIGIGTGLNLAHYGHDVELLGFDSQPAYLERARTRASEAGIERNVTLASARAEALPVADHAFDFVIATLVFCTIAEPDRALEEVKRVLRPGGNFRMIEHVRGRSPAIAGVQDVLTPIWRRLFDGCHLNRDTLALVRSSGFVVQSLREHAGGLFVEAQMQSPEGGSIEP